MKKTIKIILGTILLLAVAITIVIVTINPDKYRSQIAEALSKQTGRAIKLDGPINLTLSFAHGATLTLRDSAIGNPAWASRKDMAGIGSFNLGVAMLPLLSKEFIVTRLEIVNADIKLETDASGHHNWELAPSEQQNAATTKAKKETHNPVTIRVDQLNVRDSQLIFADKDGKANIFQVKTLTLGAQTSGAGIHFNGIYNGAPLTLVFNTGIKDLATPAVQWPFDADLAYGIYTVKAEGTANTDKSTADIKSYDITAGDSHLHGKLALGWAGRPVVNGTLLSGLLRPSDFQTAQGQGTANQIPSAESNSNRVFSNDPLPFDVLRSFNADVTFKVDEIPLANGSLKAISGRMIVADGVLSLNPFSAQIGSDAIAAQIRVNANTNLPQIEVAAKAPLIKMQNVLTMLYSPDFLSGNAYAEINISSSGNSLHALAENSVGIINFSAGTGEISSSAVGAIASGLMAVFAPSSSNRLNCLVARFIIKNGIGHDNGILVDTSSTTVAGHGGFDLGREAIDMTLRTKTKEINVGSLVPPMRVNGSFTNPNFSMDPTETLEKVANIFSGGSLDSGVPDMLTSPGKNSCIYTLDHPSSGTSTQTVTPSSVTGKLGAGLNAIKGMLGQ